MLMPWHQHHGIFIIISVLILQSCPSIITHRRRQRQDLWLDTGQPPDDISDAAAAHTAAIQLRSSCSSDTSRASFWQKVLPIFSTSAWAPYQSRHSPLSILHQKHIHCTLNHQPPENYATWRNFIFFLWFDPDFVDLWQPHP